jgi:hypothetical protein
LRILGIIEPKDNFVPEMEFKTQELSESMFKELDFHLESLENEFLTGLCEFCEYYDTNVEVTLETIQIFNEGIILSTFNLIKRAVASVLGFMKGIVRKIREFFDAFSTNTKEWVTKYEAKVLGKKAESRNFTYTGYNWDLDYVNNSKYPVNRLDDDTAKQTEALSRAVKDFERAVTTKDADYNKLKDDLENAYPDGFEDSFKKRIEEMLGCEVGETYKHYYEKATRGEKVEITGFRRVSVESMLKFIKAAPDLLSKVTDEYVKLGKKIDVLYDNIEKIDVNKIESKIEKTVEDAAKQVKEEKKNANKGKNKGKVKPDKGEFEGEEPIGDSVNTMLNEAWEDETDTKSDDTNADSKADYTSFLRDTLSSAIKSWNTVNAVMNSVRGVRVSIIQNATKEFIYVLTKLANTK